MQTYQVETQENLLTVIFQHKGESHTVSIPLNEIIGDPIKLEK